MIFPMFNARTLFTISFVSLSVLAASSGCSSDVLDCNASDCKGNKRSDAQVKACEDLKNSEAFKKCESQLRTSSECAQDKGTCEADGSYKVSGSTCSAETTAYLKCIGVTIP
jgi:hypothetical protein